MKFNDIVRIGVARPGGSGGWHPAAALPAVLEQFGLRVFQERITTRQELMEFWSRPAVEAQATVFFCHGWGESDADAVMNWPLFDPETWEVSDFHLTPGNVGEVVKRGSGILVSLACWSGKRSYADAFLKAGFEHYVAPEATSDLLSALQFVTAFFGYLMWEQRDYKPLTVQVCEAVAMARRIDDFYDGANGFRCFGS